MAKGAWCCGTRCGIQRRSPCPGLPAHLGAQRWETISSLTTRKEQLPSKSFPFSQCQGSRVAFPNKSLRDVVLPPEQGAGEAHGSRSPGAHTVPGSREMLQTQVGSLSSKKSHATAVPTVLPISTPQPPNESTAGQRNLRTTGTQLSQAHHYARKCRSNRNTIFPSQRSGI